MVCFGPNFLLQLICGGFGARILWLIVQLPKFTFFFDEIKDGLTNRRFGVIVALRLRCGCVDCLYELSHKVTASSLSSSWVVMSVSILVRLSFSVLCSKSSMVLSNR